MGAFSRGVEDCRVLSRFYAHYFVIFSGYCEFGHAEGTGVVSLARENTVVGQHGWFVEYFFASFVRALKFFFMIMPVENLNVNRLLYVLFIEYSNI
jgi:hypothetical protein